MVLRSRTGANPDAPVSPACRARQPAWRSVPRRREWDAEGIRLRRRPGTSVELTSARRVESAGLATTQDGGTAERRRLPWQFPLLQGIAVRSLGPPLASPVDILIAVDESGSITPAQMTLEQTAARLIALGEFARESKVGVLGFGGPDGLYNAITNPQPPVDLVCPMMEVGTPASRQSLSDCIGKLHIRKAEQGNQTDFIDAFRDGVDDLTRTRDQGHETAAAAVPANRWPSRHGGLAGLPRDKQPGDQRKGESVPAYSRDSPGQAGQSADLAARLWA